MTRIRGGKQIRPRIGKVGVITLAEARHKARAIIEQAEGGVDPKEAVRQAERETKRKRRNTFESMKIQWMTAPERGDLGPKTRAGYERIFEITLLPEFGDMPVDEIERDSVREWFQEYGKDAPTAANRALYLLRSVLGFAVDEGALEKNVTDRIKRFPERPRERWLEDFEIALLWRACDIHLTILTKSTLDIPFSFLGRTFGQIMDETTSCITTK